MVSILMSAYNASQTIEKAITSCLNQTYKDIEIVVVNDASTDNTEEIILSLVEKDNRVRYFKHDTNLGAGWARNTAVHNMKGDYSTFVDSDDYVKENYVETLYNAAVEHSTELICSGCIFVIKGKEYSEEYVKEPIIKEGVNKFNFVGKCFNLYTVGTLVSKRLWENVEYNTEKYIEDMPTLLKLVYYANKRVYIPYQGYYYVQNDGSLIHTASAFKTRVFQALCFAKTIEFLKEKGENIPEMDFSARMVIFDIKNQKYTKEELLEYKDQLLYIIQFMNKYFPNCNIDGKCNNSSV